MMSTIHHIVLDIEGTTCPVSFVSETLFPYAAREVGAYLLRQGNDPEIRQLVGAMIEAWKGEEDAEAQRLLAAAQMGVAGADADAQQGISDRNPQAVLPYIDWLIRRDRKLTAWKDLQGRIWKEGYARGELKAQLYPEVADTLRAWNRHGFALSVYSSGSVAAQQLLYGHSTDGDLRRLFSHWFDTHIGLKQRTDSYQRILDAIHEEPQRVLFISDALAELQAASAAGMAVVFSSREGNPERDPGGFRSITSLSQLRFDPHEPAGA